MKLLSDASEYAMRAVVWLGQRPGETHKLREIAEGTQAAPGYLIKVLQALTRADVLTARRGSLGGFALKQDPYELTVLQIVNAVDPIERIRTCPLEIEAHGSDLCSMHRRIDDAIQEIEKSFASVTIGQLLHEPSPTRPICGKPGGCSCAEWHDHVESRDRQGEKMERIPDEPFGEGVPQS